MFVMCGIFAINKWGKRFKGMYYIHKDYLGSFETVTDGSGQVREKLSFDPCSVKLGFRELCEPETLVELIPTALARREGRRRRRNPTDWTYNNVPETFLFDRGFTGHEHLDNFDLINMNGRVYDPWLGRFLSPDPFVQAPTYSQNYNRYSYALNNPLKYTDPSGYTYGAPLDFKLGRGAFAPMGTTFQMGINGQITYAFNTFANSGHSTQFELVSTANYDNRGNFVGYTHEQILVTRDGSGNMTRSESVSENENDNVQDQGSFVGVAYYIVLPNGKIKYVGFADSSGKSAVNNVSHSGSYAVLGEFLFSDGTIKENDNAINNWWNNHWSSKFIPDVLYFNGGIIGNILFGWGYNTGVAIQIRGKEGFGFRPYETGAAKRGLHVSFGVNAGYSSYSGDSRNFSYYKSFCGEGTTGIEMDLIYGVGVAISPIDDYGGVLRSYDAGIGFGIGGSHNFLTITK